MNVTTLQAIAEAWPDGMLLAVVLFGLAIGSFLNVVIVRAPEGRSLWHPRSACPGCSAQLAWHDNIPVLSFLWLRGRCRKCGMRISRACIWICCRRKGGGSWRRDSRAGSGSIGGRCRMA